MRKQRRLARAAVGGKRLGTIGGELRFIQLHAYDTVQRAQLRVTRLHAQVTAVVLEHSASFATLKLGVLILGATGLRLDALQEAAQAPDFTLQCIAASLHVDGHRVLCHSSVVGTEVTD